MRSLIFTGGREGDTLEEGGELITVGQQFTVTDERAEQLLAIPGLVDEPPEPPADLSKLKREELNEIARGLGVEDPEKLRNIPAVIAAIEAAEPADQSEAQAGEGQQTEPAQGSDTNPDEKEE